MDAHPLDKAAWLLGEEWDRTTCPTCGMREDQWWHFTEETDHCASCEAKQRMSAGLGDKPPYGSKIVFKYAQPDDAPVARLVDPHWKDHQ